MKKAFFSTLGVILAAAAIAGFIISAVGIIGLWSIEKKAVANLVDTMDLLDRTVQTTHDGLTIASQTLGQANGSLDALVDAVDATGQSVLDTIPFLDAIKMMTTKDLPGALATTKTAFQAAESSAKVIDTTLSLLTAIPLFSTPSYDNDVPLSDAFGGVSDSLDPISDSLKAMEDSLDDSKDNLGEVNTAFGEISTNLASIDTSLSDAQGVTDEYLVILEDLDQQLDQSREKLPGTIRGIAWFLTIALVWLALTQLGLLMQALEMLGLRFPLEKEASTISIGTPSKKEEELGGQEEPPVS